MKKKNIPVERYTVHQKCQVSAVIRSFRIYGGGSVFDIFQGFCEYGLSGVSLNFMQNESLK